MSCFYCLLTGCRQAVVLTISLVFCVHLHAESIIDVYQQALQSDPEYLAAIEQHGASSEVFIQARSLLLPSMLG